MKIAQAHNADPANTWTMGETQFSDLTQQEFAAIYLTQQSQTEEVADFEAKVDPNCQAVDWRKESGVAGQVKDQGRCGSHWAFSAVGAVEAYHAVVRAEKGCNGGSSEDDINYAAREGLTNQSDYPYTGRDEYDCERQGGEYRVNNAQKVKVCPIALQQAIKQRPVSVGVDASNWRQYTGGVLTNCGNQVKHGVLAYGFDMGSWLLKNSWGTSWGQSGFIRIRNGNTCNLLSQAFLAA